MPSAVGVPLIVIVFDAHDAVTPEGRPLAVPIPVAPVVTCVTVGKGLLMHSDGVAEAVPTVFNACTVIVPKALTVPQPPVKGTV